MPKASLAKSLNRSSDILPNAPLRSKDWLANLLIAEEDDKKALVETWLTRYFQHTRGMNQKEYASFCSKLFVKQIDWLGAIENLATPAFFATQDIAPHTRNIYDVLWNPHPVSNDVQWVKKLWLGTEDEQLGSLLTYKDVNLSLLSSEYGNLLSVLVDRVLDYDGASEEHHDSAAEIACVLGESGVRQEQGTATRHSQWQDFGYFGKYVLCSKDGACLTIEEALTLKQTVTSKHVRVFLNKAADYLTSAVYTNVDGYEYIKKQSLFSITSGVNTDVVPYYALATWLPEHQGYINACNATAMPIQEACNELCNKLLSVKDSQVHMRPTDYKDQSGNSKQLAP